MRYSAIRAVHCEAGSVAGRRPKGVHGVTCWADRFRDPGERRWTGARSERREHWAHLSASSGVRRLDCPPRGGRLQLAPRGPGSSRSTDSIRRPQPPPPERELCWGGSSIYWRAVFGLGAGAVGSADDYEAAAGSLLGGGVDARVAGASGILGLERIVATRRAHPKVVVAANDRVTREALGLLPGESLSVQRHARELLIPQAGNFSTLKRMAIMIAGALDEGRQRGAVDQHALLWHMYRVIESAALSEAARPRVWVGCGTTARGWRRSSLQGWLLFIAIAVLSMRHVVDAGGGPDAGSGGNEVEEAWDGARRAGG